MAQYPPGLPNQYPPNSGPYPPNVPGYPPTQVGYPPTQPATSPGYPPTQVGYPPTQPATSPGYPPNQGGYPQGYPANTGGYPPNVGGYPQTSPGYPPVSPNHPQPTYQNSMQVQEPHGGYPPGNSPNHQPPPGGYPPTDKLQMDNEPCAPPLSELSDLPGYEGLTFDNAALKPPTYDQSAYTPKVPQEISKNAPSLTEEEARDAVIQYVSEHCCYGSKAGKQMTIKDIRFNSAIHYKLESQGEKRETAWAFEPYKGQQTAVQAGGYAPGPWDVHVPNELGNFHNLQKEVEVPNTTNLRPCHKCIAMGRVRCKHCHGRGNKKCTWCNGRGVKTQFERTEQCTSCHGSGHDSCTWCHGSGQTTCDVCKGHCQLRYYIKLTVTWVNHTDDHISDTADLPSFLIKGVSGQTAFNDEQQRVWPISNFPDQAVNTASHDLIEKHRTAFPEEHILMQRQQVRIIPIAEVEFSWKSKEGKFFVYGFENKVHFPDYPQTCCCGCQIL